MQVIPAEFMQRYQQLVHECSTYQSVEADHLANNELSYRVATMLAIVEEGMQLL